MPHQLGGLEMCELGAKPPPTGTLFPDGFKPRVILRRDHGQHRGCILAVANCFVVGEGHVTHIQHIFEKRGCVHGQIAEGVLHDPPVGPAIPLLLKQRHQRRILVRSILRIPTPDEQQPLGSACRQAGAL